MKGTGGSLLSRVCPLHHSLVLPTKFPENNGEDNSVLFLNINVLLEVPPTSQPPRENPGSPTSANCTLAHDIWEKEQDIKKLCTNFNSTLFRTRWTKSETYSPMDAGGHIF